MAVTVNCPGCRTSYPVTEDLLGKKIRCKKCQETFTAAAAKSAVAARSDDRITTRPPAKGGAKRISDDDFEAESPRRNGNGRPRPAAKRPAAKAGGNGLLIGSIIGGVLVLVAGAGIGIWIMNRGDDTTDTSSQTNSGTPAISTGTPTGTPVADVTPPPKVEPEKTTITERTIRTAGDAPKELTLVKPMARPADFRPGVVAKVQKSAVMFTVTGVDHSGYGSGWIAERHGDEAYIITNAHVMLMKEAANPPPEKILVTLDVGTPKERSIDGKLLALDREEDLAVVRIKGKDLPPALPIAPSFDLVESQRLLTLGFPHGRNLEGEMGGGIKTTLKTRNTYVTGRIPNEDGSIKFIQVEGGVDGGNSGGAVVDTNGNVVAIVDAELRGTNMKFVIPSEYAVHLLLGRILKVMPGQAISSGPTSRLPLAALIADPLKRLRRVEADIFVGRKPDTAKGETTFRPASDGEPAKLDGDGPASTVQLEYDPNQRLPLGEPYKASGEAVLPPVGPNEVYWFRPHYFTADGKQRWAEAVVMEMGRYPVDARPAHLAIQHKVTTNAKDARRVEISTRQVSSFESEGGGGGGDQQLLANLLEKTIDVKKDTGDARVRIQYQDIHLPDATKDSFYRKQLRGVLESIKFLRGEFTVTKDGEFKSPHTDWAEVPMSLRHPILRQFNEQIITALEDQSLVLPNKDVQPGDTWTQEIHYILPLDRSVQNALFRITCKYLGSRVRDGREEAVIEMDGRIVTNVGPGGSQGGGRAGGRPSPGAPQTPATPDDGSGGDTAAYDEDGNLKGGRFGFARGAAVVDVATGHVIMARTESDMAMVFTTSITNPQNPSQTAQVKVNYGLHLESILRRGLSSDPLKPVDPLALLPNQPRIYNPMVGAAPPVVDPVGIDNTPPAGESGLMPKDMMQKVQNAAVYIIVTNHRGIASGSGWFAEPGIVVTNCHVVDMLNKTDRPPDKIDVILNAGNKGGPERRLNGKLLAVDRENDLAILRIVGDNLPEPLKVVPSEALIETQQLVVVGFPLGNKITDGLIQMEGKGTFLTQVKTRTTSVAGRVPKVDGSIKYIQIEGGADHGNSGGPVVDAKGNVRGVLVAGLDGTQLVFIIPGEYAGRLINGYPLEVLPGKPFLDGSTAKLPVQIVFIDPLNRVTKAQVDFWVGDAGKPRKPSNKAPAAATGDGKRVSVDLTFKPGVRPGERIATADIPLPDRDPGKICWLQPRFVNGTGAEQWARGIGFAPDGPPVERKGAVLVSRPQTNTSRSVELTTFQNISYMQGGRAVRDGDPLRVELTENILKASKNGTALVHLQYRKLELDVKKIYAALEQAPPEIQSMYQSAFNARLRPLLDTISGVLAVVQVNNAGKMKLVQLNMARVPPQAQPIMTLFNGQILTALQALSFPMPGKVEYGQTWENTTNLFVPTSSRTQGGLFKMKFKYLGVRERAGRREALIEIGGSLAADPNAKGVESTDTKAEPAQPSDPDKGKDTPDPSANRYQAPAEVASGARRKGLYGDAHGYAIVDLQDGFVAEVQLYIDMDVEILVKDPGSKQDLPVTAGGTMELHLRRRPGK